VELAVEPRRAERERLKAARSEARIKERERGSGLAFTHPIRMSLEANRAESVTNRGGQVTVAVRRRTLDLCHGRSASAFPGASIT
jgi:hypothetical protein